MVLKLRAIVCVDGSGVELRGRESRRGGDQGIKRERIEGEEDAAFN